MSASRGKEWIDIAIGRAEQAASKLRFLKPDGKYAGDELYEAWDKLNTASENLRDAAREFGFPDPRTGNRF